MLAFSIFANTSTPLAALAPFVYVKASHAATSFFPFWLGLILQAIEWAVIGAVFAFRFQGRPASTVWIAAVLVVGATWIATLLVLGAMGVDAGRIHM
jgi:hypothetical protein